MSYVVLKPRQVLDIPPHVSYDYPGRHDDQKMLEKIAEDAAKKDA